MNTLIKQKYKNPLEEALYSSPEVKRLPRSKPLNHLYERGMMISISNNEMYYDQIYQQNREQYISLYRCLTDKKIGRFDINRIQGIPDQEKLIELIVKKVPIMVCGIHSYKNPDQYDRQFHHQHLLIFNCSHFIPKESKKQKKMEAKIKSYFHRYLNIGQKKLGKEIRITPIGIGEHFHKESEIAPTTLHEYLTNPKQNTIINYITQNRHQPEINFPLTTIYLTNYQL